MDYSTLLPIIGSFARQGLAAGGGYIVAHGLASSDQATALQGGAMALAALLWSLYQKWQHAKALAAATAPAPVTIAPKA